VVQPGSLRGQVTGDLDIKPILNLRRQMNDFEGHGGIPVQFQGLTGEALGPPMFLGSAGIVYIAYPANRFQYLSVNIP
jgi:hypothetical protein